MGKVVVFCSHVEVCSMRKLEVVEICPRTWLRIEVQQQSLDLCRASAFTLHASFSFEASKALYFAIYVSLVPSTTPTISHHLLSFITSQTSIKSMSTTSNYNHISLKST